ncbi:MAG: hypothetical protein QOC73_284, partial [Actinomycetota bacterium]|nr:hypothetical protein [Actinomycetota bacterium]
YQTGLVVPGGPAADLAADRIAGRPARVDVLLAR